MIDNIEAPANILNQSRAPEIIAGNAVLQVLGTIVFLARVYSRVVLSKAWKIEDTVLASTWILACIYSVCQYGQVTCGAGNHSSIIKSPVNLVMLQQYAYVAQIALIPALAFSKVSICLFYVRVFDSDRRGRALIVSLIVLLVGTSIPFFFQGIFQCAPIEVYWTEFRPESKCINDIHSLYIYGAINVFTDLALIAIVLPRVIGLTLNNRQRYALVGIVLLGLLAAGAGLARSIRVGQTLAIYKSDPMWNAFDISIWTSTEIYVSLICAAAPGTKPLVIKLIPKLLGSAGQKERAVPIQVEVRRRRPSTFAYLHKKSLSISGWTVEYGKYSHIGKESDEESGDEKVVVQRRPSQGVNVLKKLEPRDDVNDLR
ncbi:hypothetical protein B0J11DRAFT_601033 [Dendryphion nanum]|uniref:Rhodopsin domain-containing protein n=1 Tax=Dendryphion nanum TaxID=256645 RepID=A0A9P9E7Y4_9PLEO|nr:hypothetical protein B0J11DRAFT_601033 [Dendryphion nanum]